MPSTVLHVNAGLLALINIPFLLVDYAVSCEDFLISQPVLRHLCVYRRTLLQDRVRTLNGTACSPDLVGTTTSGRVSRLMLARLNSVDNDQVYLPTDPDITRSKVNYYTAPAEEDLLPDSSLLDPVDMDHHEDIKAAIRDMQCAAFEAGLAEEKGPALAKILSDHMVIFQTSFSTGPLVRLPPLKVGLAPEVKPVKVCLRNYSQEQRHFLDKFLKALVRHGLAYPTPTSKWACAPLLVPKPWQRNSSVSRVISGLSTSSPSRTTTRCRTSNTI